MPSEPETQGNTEEKQTRITVKLDEFDHKVVHRMATNRNTSLSNAMRNIVHQWIETNPEILKRNYGVDVEEITEEIALESAKISVDKTLKPYEKAIINELPQFFEMVEDVSLTDLAECFDVSIKAIKNIIFTHSEQIKKTGLNLKYRENRIYKE